MPYEIVTIGETLACLSIPDPATLRSGSALVVGVGGAESNVAIAARQLGVRATWMGRVGDDDVGSLVVRELRGADIEVIASRDTRAPTGLMLKEHRRGRPVRVRYYRTGSAGSRLTLGDVDVARVANADALHVTGITAALGPGPRAAIEHAMRTARAANTLVSFDVNFRETLWSENEAVAPLRDLARLADLVFAGPEEARLLTAGHAAPLPGGDPWRAAEQVARDILALGPHTAVVKLGALGALVLGPSGVHRQPATPTTVVDPVGAGDAFVGGFLGEAVQHHPVQQCAASGARLGSLVCAVRGDWEGSLDWHTGVGPSPDEDLVDVRR
jgi:2-dehydro-3-deoxygluconokinase